MDETKIASAVEKRLFKIFQQMVTEWSIQRKEHLNAQFKADALEDSGKFAAMKQDVIESRILL